MEKAPVSEYSAAPVCEQTPVSPPQLQPQVCWQDGAAIGSGVGRWGTSTSQLESLPDHELLVADPEELLDDELLDTDSPLTEEGLEEDVELLWLDEEEVRELLLFVVDSLLLVDSPLVEELLLVNDSLLGDSPLSEELLLLNEDSLPLVNDSSLAEDEVLLREVVEDSLVLEDGIAESPGERDWRLNRTAHCRW